MLRRSRLHTRSRAGSTDVRLRALVDDHTDAIFRVAVSIVQDRALAEDVVQETIIKAWRSLDSYRGEGSERSWILQIAHHTAVSSLRRIRDEATDPGELPDRPELLDPERHFTGRADLDHIASILEQLDELSRSILVLRDVEGMTYQQIAETLDVPIPTVKTRLLRARRELQRLAQVGDRS